MSVSKTETKTIEAIRTTPGDPRRVQGPPILRVQVVDWLQQIEYRVRGVCELVRGLGRLGARPGGVKAENRTAARFSVLELLETLRVDLENPAEWISQGHGPRDFLAPLPDLPSARGSPPFARSRTG